MRRACPRGSTGTSHARRSAARERRCAARAGPSYGPPWTNPPEGALRQQGGHFVAQRSSSDQFRMSFDNPSSPLQRGPFSTHIRGPVSVSIDTEPGACVAARLPSDRAPFPPRPPPPLLAALLGRFIGTTRLVRPLCSLPRRPVARSPSGRPERSAPTLTASLFFRRR
jgi:hypothetical protein